MPGDVYLVGAGPGSPDLITVRGWRLLRDADVVLYDALVDPELLDGVHADLLFVGKRAGHHSMTQEGINELMLTLAREGKTVVRLKGGDPCVFGRGGEEAMYLRERGVDVEIVPGISSSVAAATYAGIPVTHRGVSEGFSVVTAHRRAEDANFALPSYDPRRTLVLLMGVGTMADWRAELLEDGYPADLPVALVTWAATTDQRVVTTTLDDCVRDARMHDVTPPTTAIIGHVVALREGLEWFVPSNAEAKRVY